MQHKNSCITDFDRYMESNQIAWLPNNICESLPKDSDVDVRDNPLVCCPSSIAARGGCSNYVCQVCAPY
jgi:hypothetical protein